MINKQNLWFVTLFSLILILGIYYVGIGDEVNNVLKEEKQKVTTTIKENNEDEPVIEITPSDVLVALEVENMSEKESLMEEYQSILLSIESTIEEKNNAYENISKLNDSKTLEEKIKTKLKEDLNLESFVKIKDNSINIVVNAKNHTTELANNIIKLAQSLFEEEKYITVKFN